MTEQEIAAYKDQMFGNNGQSLNQSPTPELTDTPPAITEETTTEVVQTPTQQEITENITVTPVTEQEIVDEDKFVKERLGYDTWEAAKADIELLRAKASTPAEIKFANEQSQRLFDAIKEGKDDLVYEILDTKMKLAKVDKMSAAEALKLHIQQTNKHYSPEDVADVFDEKYAYPEKPNEDDVDYDERMIKYKAAVEKIDRRKERDAVTAKSELAKLNSELVLPDIQKPESPEIAEFQSWKKNQEELSKLDTETKQAYSKFSPKELTMLFKFNDEASKLAFDIAYEPDKESFDKAVANASDMQTFFSNYYDEDGSPKRKEFLKDLYAGQNINKIVSEAVKQATNQTKAWFLKNQKNIGDGVQRNFVIPPTTDIDKLRQAVFG